MNKIILCFWCPRIRRFWLPKTISVIFWKITIKVKHYSKKGHKIIQFYKQGHKILNFFVRIAEKMFDRDDVMIWIGTHFEGSMNKYFVRFCMIHGRPQTFFQGRAKIFQGGQEPTFCLKTTKKNIFSKKVWKHTIFGRPWPARGARAPLSLPCGRPWYHCQYILPCEAFTMIKPKIRSLQILWLMQKDPFSLTFAPNENRPVTQDLYYKDIYEHS